MKKLIPFDYAKYQAGAKPVFRNLEIKEILDIKYYPQSKSEYKIVVIWLNDFDELRDENFTEKGDYLLPNKDNLDLMLEIDVPDEPEKPAEQDDYILDLKKLVIAMSENIALLHGRIMALENFISQNYPNDLITTDVNNIPLRERIINMNNISLRERISALENKS